MLGSAYCRCICSPRGTENRLDQPLSILQNSATENVDTARTRNMIACMLVRVGLGHDRTTIS